jgi:phasin family protein
MIKHKNETLAKATAESVEHAREFLQTSLESIEKVAKLQLDSSKKMLDETSQAIKEISSSGNPQDFFSKLNQLATHSVESNISNCRDLYQILSEVQANIGKVIENNIHHTQHNIATAVEGLSQYKPSNANASEAFKGWINSANHAISTMQKVASQVTEFTNQSIKAATENVAKKTTAKK